MPHNKHARKSHGLTVGGRYCVSAVNARHKKRAAVTALLGWCLTVAIRFINQRAQKTLFVTTGKNTFCNNGNPWQVGATCKTRAQYNIG